MVDPKVREMILLASGYAESICELARLIRLEDERIHTFAALDWYEQDVDQLRKVQAEFDELVCN